MNLLKSILPRRPRADPEPPRHLPADPGFEYFVWLLNRMPSGVPPALARSGAAEPADDRALVERVQRTYRREAGRYQASLGEWDNGLFDVKNDVHQILAGDDAGAAAAALRDPASNTLFRGFDAIASPPSGQPEPHELVLRRLNKSADWKVLYSLWLCDALVSFSEAIGARRADFPEIEIENTLAARRAVYDIDLILDEIEARLGLALRFPNPFRDEIGLGSKRGIIGFHAIQSVYQAWRIAQLGRGTAGFKVLEVGAGLGRTAYFASLFGVRDYTIIDIPLTNAAQGYFLGRVLGAEQVELAGEPRRGGVRILPATVMPDHDERYDLIVNVDSWTEMPPAVARMYWAFARRASGRVLSINHEFNPVAVRDLYQDDPAVTALRYPYPMRRGYLEEILSW